MMALFRSYVAQILLHCWNWIVWLAEEPARKEMRVVPRRADFIVVK